MQKEEVAEQDQGWSMTNRIPEFVRQYANNSITEYIKKQLDYVWNYEKKVEELDRVVENLKKDRDWVRGKAEEDEGRYGRAVYDHVLEWLARVGKMLPDYEKFKDEHDKHDKYPLTFLNLEIRYNRSKTAEHIKESAKTLREEKRNDISRWQGPFSEYDAFSNVDYEEFESRRETMDKIMEALENPSARMIGVHGRAGVGKTTLVIEAINKARELKLFNMEIMVNVTKSSDTIKIQGQIAEMLGMKLEEESEHARAIRIQKRLKKAKENTLIILDDLCTQVDLNKLGIPSEVYNVCNDFQKNPTLEEGKSSALMARKKTKETKQPLELGAIKTEKNSGGSSNLKTEERYKGYKVLLISEARLVLSQMNVKEDLIYLVDALNGKEAVNLFKTRAGIGDKNSKLEKLAAEIAEKCHGLPMSIVTTARALKDQSPSVWKDANRKLERQNIIGTPEYSTKLSYNLLENEELKITFLLCARMDHDASVMDLVRYCIGLGFLQGTYTVREVRDRVQMLLVKLKQSGLLSDGYSSDHFTMQNIVRNAALSIASQENHVFTSIEGKLDEWLDWDKLKRYTAIFLRHCDVIEEFPNSIKCPRLRVFHVENNDSCLKIPSNFFQQMKELRVLILTGINLSPLPSSIRCLTKLRMLCLEQCILGETLSIIGELKNLRILSFSRSNIIKSLPVELKHLSKLQIFDISNCSKLVIPPDIISSLTRLEELYMRNTSIWTDDEGQKRQSENASLSELVCLNQLTNLDIQIPSVAQLPKNLFFDKLHSFKIFIGSSNRYLELDFKMPEKYELSRFLAIQQKKGFDIHSQKGIKMLFERVENLLLGKLNGVQDLFNELNLKGFPYLKHLSIVSNSNIESLINPKDRKHPEKAFPKLQSLDFYKLKNLKEICSSSCELLSPSFGKLKIIKIKLCGQLKNIFLISMVKSLIALETIQVSECDSLKEIVHVENANDNEVEENANNNEVEFSALRSLKLQSLNEFIGFGPISLEGDTKILFHKEVLVSKLERMELSAIQIDKIWIDQSSHFENLTHLDVNSCCNLKYLLPLSMAINLGNLQSLFISDCDNMGNIFHQGQAGGGKTKYNIFPKLKNIKLSNMKSLSEIWNSKIHVDSFGKLDTLIIEKCNKLVNVFPFHMAGIFQSLGSLRVTSCKSMKAIFDLADKKRDARYVINLQDVHLETLPKLEHVLKWEKGQEGIIKLNNLQNILIHNCDSLGNIFPVFVAKNLENLENLVVWDCIRLREVAAKGENANTENFVLSKLTTVKFWKLPKFKSFYPGSYTLDCPLLNDLSVELCDKLELFKQEITDAPSSEETAIAQRRLILFPDEVINKLKSMQIELQHAKSLTCYRRDNLEELRLSKLKNTDILYSFLHSNPNLNSLWLNNCSFEELVPLERPAKIVSLGVVPKLKGLKLTDLAKLEKIGFERDIILQRIEFLILKNCCSLNTLAPPAVSLTHLTNLEVADCKGLKYLMPPSTAKSLGQLSTMKVINCASLEEIVSEQGSEEKEENATTVNITFRQLKALELVSLKSIESFCSSKSCVYEFPSLEKLVVSACPKMKIFSQEESSPILQKIYFVHDKEKKRWCWEGTLQATIQHMFKNKKFFEGMDELSVSAHLDDLQQFWQGKEGLQKDWFYSLRTLKLENCEFELHAIPSNVLRCLKSLKELEVGNCGNIRGIFEMNDTKIRGTSFQLKKLTLKRLQNVTHVWQQGIPGFQNLQEVTVYRCRKLNTLFPAALARDLKMLDKLDVNGCDELQEIVGKKEGAEEGTEKFVFPRLTELKLRDLPQLTYFYSEGFTLECPQLNILQVTDCNKLGLFQSQQKAHSEGQGSTAVIGQPLFSDIKAVSKVETLCLNWNEKDTSVLRSWLGQPTAEVLQYLCQLVLCFDDDDDDDLNESSTFPFEILEKTPNLEAMGISNCRRLKKLFPSHSRETGNRMLGNLKRLYLHSLSELHSIAGLECLTKLQLLCVYDCPRLTISAQSFSNLKELHIHERDELPSLFTSSEAKMLIHLEEIYIDNCGSMKEILGKEQNETATATEEIKFERLERIRLEDLSSLECFYSGNATLKLPSLIQVDIVRCSEMRIFSPGNVEHSRRIQVSYDPNDDLVFHCNLNAAVVWQFLHQTRLDLGDFPKPKEIWLGKVPLPDDGSSSKLKYLEVEGCEFLSNAILPSHLLPFLSNLEELVVRKCDSVEAIFDVKDTPTYDSNMIVIPLKKLTLEQLPTLRHVWNKDPKGSFSFPFLEEVTVNECKSIKSLLPVSFPKDNLRELDVRNCVELVEIVAKGEAAAKESNKEVIVFPRLTSLTLWDLPNLSCIYSGMQILGWPMLEILKVSHCQMLKIFATDVENSPDSYPEGQDRFTKDKHGFISAGKTCFVPGDYPELNKKWLAIVPIPEGWSFITLKYLEVEGCEFLSDAMLPSPLLPFLSNLEELVVRKCDSVEAIFDVKGTTTHDPNMIVVPLKKLTLKQLPALRHVWNKDPKGSLSLPFLKEVTVNECKSIKSLFPPSVAKDKLKKLDVKNCVELVEIVAKDEAATEEANKEVIMFPSLTSLTLWELPNLRCICSGIQILDWPKLKDLDVYHCQMLKIFTADFQDSPDSYPEDRDHITTDKHGVVSARKVVTPNLERLSLNEEDIIMIEKGLLHVNFEKVNFLMLQSFNDESDAFPDVFFSKMSLRGIQKFVVADSAFREIFSSQRPGIDYARNLSQLKELELRSLQKLNSIGLEHSWMAPLLETLQGLRVLACSCLTNLALSTVCFSHLTRLDVEDCARLEYLFTSSTAKSLVALEEISISNCESLETVVAHEEGNKAAEDMTFPGLWKLTLSELPKLGSFYAGKSTLNFPLLDNILITQCKRLEYLFTSSTTKSLVALEKISISNCESLETVVAHEEGDKSDEDVTFPELWDVTLRELPKLGNFYTGKSTLCFPQLRCVLITQCKSMKTFSHSNVVARNLKTVDIEGVNRLDDDLNTAVHQQFEKEAALSNEIVACSEKLTHIAFNHANLED